MIEQTILFQNTPTYFHQTCLDRWLRKSPSKI